MPEGGGGVCYFMHIKSIPLCLKRKAEGGRRWRGQRRRGKRRDRSGGRRERERKGGSSRRGSRSRSRSGTGDEGGP